MNPGAKISFEGGPCPLEHPRCSVIEQIASISPPALRHAPHPCPPCVKGGWRAQRGGGIALPRCVFRKCSENPAFSILQSRLRRDSSLYTRGSRINPGANISFEGGPCPLELPRCSVVEQRSGARICGKNRQRTIRLFRGNCCKAPTGKAAEAISFLPAKLRPASRKVLFPSRDDRRTHVSLV